MSKTLVVEAQWITRHEVTVEDDWTLDNDDHCAALYTEIELQLDPQYHEIWMMGWSVKEKKLRRTSR